jgi:hypothetical protein
VASIAAAMRRWEAPATAAAEAERQRRAAAEAARLRTGQPRRGPAPKPGEASPSDQAQSPWTEAARPIRRPHHQGWASGGHAQARVDATCQLLLAWEVTDAANDTQQAAPRAQATLAVLSQAGLEPPRDATGAAQARAATLDRG